MARLLGRNRMEVYSVGATTNIAFRLSCHNKDFLFVKPSRCTIFFCITQRSQYLKNIIKRMCNQSGFTKLICKWIIFKRLRRNLRKICILINRPMDQVFFHRIRSKNNDYKSFNFMFIVGVCFKKCTWMVTLRMKQERTKVSSFSALQENFILIDFSVDF